MQFQRIETESCHRWMSLCLVRWSLPPVKLQRVHNEDTKSMDILDFWPITSVAIRRSSRQSVISSGILQSWDVAADLKPFHKNPTNGDEKPQESFLCSPTEILSMLDSRRRELRETILGNDSVLSRCGCSDTLHGYVVKIESGSPFWVEIRLTQMRKSE